MAQVEQYQESMIDYAEFLDFINKIKTLKPSSSVTSKKTLDLFRLYLSIKLSGLSLDDFFQVIPIKYVNAMYLQKELIKYVVQNRLFNFGNQWYLDLRRAINEVNYRYTRKKLIMHNSLHVYKVLFRLYCRLVEDKVYNSASCLQLENLICFIAAQYSARFHPVNGLVIPVNLETFQFDSCNFNYKSLKLKNYPPTMIDPGICYLYHTGGAPYYGLSKKMLSLQDSESDKFITYELPTLQGKIPNLKKYDTFNLKLYLAGLEFCMIRASLLQRKFNSFLLSIEHLRTYAYAKSNHPLVFPNTF